MKVFEAPLSAKRLDWPDIGGATMSASRAHTGRIRVRPVRSVSGPDWLARVLDRLEEIARLPVGWNGSDTAMTPGPETLERALAALAIFMPEAAVGPQTVATPEGGVRFEWHAGQVDLVVEVDPHAPIEAWAEDRSSGAAWEGEWPAVAVDIEATIRILSTRVWQRSST